MLYYVKWADLGFSGSSLSWVAELDWNHLLEAPPACNLGGKKSLSVTCTHVKTALSLSPKVFPHTSHFLSP